MKIFIDSSVIIAALISPQGGSGQLLMLCETKILQGIVSEYIIAELEEVVTRKIPEAKMQLKKLLAACGFVIKKKPPTKFLKKAYAIIKHKKDAAVLAAAMQSTVSCLVTLDLKHFIKDPLVAKKSKLTILTPGDFLGYWRKQIEKN